jgi:hypothetical protein
MHLVHTFMRLTPPFSRTLTVWMFAFHFLLVCLVEWDTVLPEIWPFPQIEHFLDIVLHLLSSRVKAISQGAGPPLAAPPP